MKNHKKIKFALMSVADIKNFGDTLFPFVSRKQILKYFPNAEFRFFTPTKCKIENEEFFEYSLENLNEYAPDVILTIGGEVIHKYDNIVWQDMYHKEIKTPSNVFFGWLDYPAKYKAWFSVGALDLSLPQDEEITHEELSKLNYIALRGILSKKILEKNQIMFMNKGLDLVPDIGWTFANYFKRYIFNLFKMSYMYKFPFFLQNYIVLNVNWTSISVKKFEEVLTKLKEFSKKTNYKIVIIDVISTYKNLDYNLQNFTETNKEFIYLKDCSLDEIGAILCGCRFFIGSSLHCAITALSNNKPAALIHNVSLSKFQDMFGHMMRTDLLSNNWDDLESLLNLLNNFDRCDLKILQKYVNFMRSLYLSKFEKMMYVIKNVT